MKYQKEYDAIYRLMEEGDFPSAVRRLVRLADDGEAQAAYLLGYMYYTGKGVEPSHEIAVGFLEASAKKGFIPAVKLLGGIKRKKASLSDGEIKVLKAEADGGDAKACYKYAVLLMRGEGVERNKELAVEYFDRAAKKGHFLSMIALFDRFAIDADIEKQWTRAYFWFKQAWVIDRDRLNIVHPNIIDGEKLFLEAEDERLPVEKRKEMLEQAAKQGFHGAYAAYGDLCDPAQAIDFYEKGAEFGDCEALKRLAEAYEKGDGVEKDENNAAFYGNEYERLSAFIE
ncbi:MAG: sel1 repeat family protein [Clostridia bacterium]|nr:sel1 repeat family protein [Clostridia bacterium]